MDNETYLAHHGIKGQRWYHRRYQNPDGSLTAEGRERYGVKEIREKSRAERAMVRERAKAARKMEKLRYKEQVKDEKRVRAQNLADQKRKQKLKDIERARRQKEYAARKETEEKNRAADIEKQKKQIAQFKKDHPLKYKQLKKYLKEDGTLNDAGKARFFGTGNKKSVDQMSTEDLRKTTDRMFAEKSYNQALYELKKSDPSSRRRATAGKVLGSAGLAFVSSFLGKSLDSGWSKDSAISNGKAAVADALEIAAISTTRQLGLSSKKGGKGYNAFEGATRGVSRFLNDNSNKPASSRNTSNRSGGYWEIRRNGDVITIDRNTGEIVRVEPEEYYNSNRR